MPERSVRSSMPKTVRPAVRDDQPGAQLVVVTSMCPEGDTFGAVDLARAGVGDERATAPTTRATVVTTTMTTTNAGTRARRYRRKRLIAPCRTGTGPPQTVYRSPPDARSVRAGIVVRRRPPRARAHA